VSVATGRPPSPFSLDGAAIALLAKRVDRAVARARRQGEPVMAAVTVPVPAELDLSAAVLSARRPADRYLCLELPDRDRFALAALGTAALVETHGRRRFAEAAERARRLGRGALREDPADDPLAPLGSGPVFVGGFAFAEDGGRAPEWSSLAPVQLVLPELALARLGDQARLTVCAVAGLDDDPRALLERALRRVAELRPASMPLLDPDPLGRARVGSALPPAHYEEAVARAVERIRGGELEKVVLAREVRVKAGRELDPAPMLDALRAVFPSCYCFCVGSGELAFVGASPELLVRREGSRAQTVALAGTARRSADPAVDDHLGEQLRRSAKDRSEHAIVARRIERALRAVSLWVALADDPALVKVHNLQHLATPIRAQLAQPVPALELAGRLHPTPAVGGEPAQVAERLIPALEGLDRGWYAGGVGFTDLSEDGEFCVALRCALLRGESAHLYVGCGVVADSVPAAELAESEVKLEALLPLLA
jgi:salicylate biosynthesis isochorismate synthase